MPNQETTQRSQHYQNRPATAPLAAQGVRRRRTVPTIQLSKATVAAIVLGILAGITFGVGVARLDGWDAAAMTSAEGQHALANFIATATLAGMLAVVAAVVWSASASATRQAAETRDRIRGEAALRRRIDDVDLKVGDVLAGQAAITARFLAVVDDVRRDVRVSRQPKTAPQRRRRRKSTAPTPTFDEIVDGSNVIQMPRPETVALVERIIRRSINGAVKFPDGTDR